MNAIQRDQCYGRRLSRTGVNPVTRSTHVPDASDRVLDWRCRARVPGFGSRAFGRSPVEGCPHPDSPEIDPRDVIQAKATP